MTLGISNNDDFYKDLLHWITMPFFIIYFLIFVAPRWLIYNMFYCPFYDQPYGKCKSLLCDSERCKLGDARFNCCHYWRTYAKTKAKH